MFVSDPLCCARCVLSFDTMATLPTPLPFSLPSLPPPAGPPKKKTTKEIWSDSSFPPPIQRRVQVLLHQLRRETHSRKSTMGRRRPPRARERVLGRLGDSLQRGATPLVLPFFSFLLGGGREWVAAAAAIIAWPLLSSTPAHPFPSFLSLSFASLQKASCAVEKKDEEMS